jgi:hypothetical protein
MFNSKLKKNGWTNEWQIKNYKFYKIDQAKHKLNQNQNGFPMIKMLWTETKGCKHEKSKMFTIKKFKIVFNKNYNFFEKHHKWSCQWDFV